MLNNPGEYASVPQEAETAKESDFSPLRQILIITLVGLYLFSMVWVYAHLPVIAIGGVIVAGIIMLLASLRRLFGGGKLPHNS